MSGDGKRGDGRWPPATAPILDSTETDMPVVSPHVRCWGQSGPHASTSEEASCSALYASRTRDTSAPVSESTTTKLLRSVTHWRSSSMVTYRDWIASYRRLRP